jgi:hypothetical protein
MELDRWLLPLRGDRMCPKRFAMVFGPLPPTVVETALLRLLVLGLLVRLLWMMMLPVDEYCREDGRGGGEEKSAATLRKSWCVTSTPFARWGDEILTCPLVIQISSQRPSRPRSITRLG